MYYLELRFFFRSHPLHTPLPVTVEKLAEIWHCTPRYVKKVVRKLGEWGWIGWQAGKGRGHTSVLTLLRDGDEVLLEEIKKKAGQGDRKSAHELLSRFGNGVVRERFLEWLSEGIGFSQKTVSDRMQDTLRFPVYRRINTLDPGMVYYDFDAHLAAQLFQTLLEYDRQTRTFHPCIAHAWEMLQRDQEWIFYLKKGVLFHHGRELTAREVVFSLNRIRLHPERFACSWMFRGIARIEALDPHAVRIQLQEPNTLFLQFLCTIYASILPEDLAGKSEEAFARHPVGTGPFQLVRSDDAICILEAFPRHFRGRPQLDRVEVLLLPDMEPGTLKEPDWNSVFSSEGDANLAKRRQQSIADGMEGWRDLEMRYACCSVLVFNQWKTGPQNHPLFRQALHLLLDRDRMIADLGDFLIDAADGFHPRQPHLSGKRGKASRSGHDTSSSASRAEIEALLQACGYRGEPFLLHSNAFHETEALWIQERCRMFGVNAEVAVTNESFDPTLPLPDARLFGVVHRNDECCELEWYCHKDYFLSAFDPQVAAQVNELTHSVMREPGYAERLRKLAALEELMRQTHSLLFLAHKKSHTSYHHSVRGISINIYGWFDFHKIWFHPLALPESGVWQGNGTR